jgi:hypothetical protein
MSMSKKATIAFAVLVLVAVGVALLTTMWQGCFVAAAQPCVNNLRQLEGAKEEWALENHKDGDTSAVPAWQDIQPYLNHKLTCPDGGTYILGRVGELPRCSLAGQRTNGRIHAQPKG